MLDIEHGVNYSEQMSVIQLFDGQALEATEAALPAVSIDEKQAHILGRAFWRMVELYKFTREEQAALLGIKLNRERLLSYQKQNLIPIDPDKFARVGHLLGIHKNLRILFPHNRETVYGWFRVKRPWFHDRCALDFITEEPINSLARLFTVRRMLDYVRCAY